MFNERFDWLSTMCDTISTSAISDALWEKSVDDVGQLMCEVFDLVEFIEYKTKTNRGYIHYYGFEGDDKPKFALAWSSYGITSTTNKDLNMFWYALNESAAFKETPTVNDRVNSAGRLTYNTAKYRYTLPLMYVITASENTKTQGFRYIKDGHNAFMYATCYGNSASKSAVLSSIFNADSGFSFGILDFEYGGISRRTPIHSGANIAYYDDIYSLWVPFQETFGERTYGIDEDFMASVNIFAANQTGFAKFYDKTRPCLIEPTPKGCNVSNAARLYMLYYPGADVVRINKILSINNSRYIVLATNYSYRFSIVYKLHDEPVMSSTPETE